MASETARLAALVASLPWTSTPMPISVIQRTRAMGDFAFGVLEGYQPFKGCLNMQVLRVRAQSIFTIQFQKARQSHAPRMRGIQYAASSRFHCQLLWNTGSPASAGDDH